MEEKKPGFIRRNYRRLMSFISALRLLVINLVFLIVVGVLIFVLTTSQLPQVPEQGALIVNISGSLVDQKTYIDPISSALGQSDPQQHETLVQDVIDAINYAKDDDRIKVLVLSLDNMVYGSIAKLQEIAPVLQSFRESDKKIIAFGDNYSQDQYWLATQADEIYLHPMGGVLLQGYGLFRNYFKQGLDKLNIDFHIFRVGEYKSAMEPFIRNDMSVEAKRSNQVWLNTLWDEYTASIVDRRQLPANAIDDYANNIDQLLEQNQGNSAAVALNSGLVDALKTHAEINDYLVELVGSADENGRFKSVGFEQYLWLQALELPKADVAKKVGVIVASGNIIDGEQPAGSIGGDTLASLIREARRDASVHAVVLRVDSGGGSAFASEVIRSELELLTQAGKPLVISMGSMAASGGYWISVPADEIWAMPTTLTGSIGIFGAFPTADRALGKLGITTDGVGTTQLSGAARIDRPLQPIAARAIQSMINHGYSQFLDIVAEGRAMSVEQVSEIAEGRVWSGIEAKNIGLVDKLGTLDQAVASAADFANLSDYDTKLIEIPLSPQEQLLQELSGNISAKIGAKWLASSLSSLTTINQLQQWLAPFKDTLSFLDTMNDPQGIYLHCTSCVAP